MQIILSAIYFEKRKETCTEGVGENFARGTGYLSISTTGQSRPGRIVAFNANTVLFSEFKRMLGSNTARTMQKFQ
jgi:hypothetical protein